MVNRRLVVDLIRVSLLATTFAVAINSFSNSIYAQNVHAAHESDAPAGREQLQIVKTGLIPQYLAVDSEGTFAVVFGQPTPASFIEQHTNARRRSINLYGGPTHVAIVNMKTHSVLATHSIDGDVQEVLVDQEHIYWKPKAVNVINRLSLARQPTLKQLPMHSTVNQIFFVGDDQLAVIATEGKIARIHVYDRSSLRLMPDHTLSQFPVSNPRHQYGKVAIHLGDDQMHVGLRIIDQRSGSVKCLVDIVHGAVSLANAATPSSTLINMSQNDSWWRRIFDEHSVKSSSNANLFSIPSGNSNFSRQLPLFASLRLTGNNYGASYLLDFREINYGKSVGQIMLGRTGELGIPRQNGIHFSGKKIVFAMYDEVAIADIDSATLEATAEPLRLLHPRIPMFQWDQTGFIDLETKGGTPPYQFHLEKHIEGVVVNASTGKVEIDFPSILEQNLGSVAEGKQGSFQITGQMSHYLASPNQSLEKSIETYSGIKTPPGKFPCYVPLTLSASDSAGNRDEIYVQAFAMVPKQELLLANQANEAIKSAQRAELLAENLAKQKSNGAGSVSSERIDALEQRLKRIESLLDRILKNADD